MKYIKKTEIIEAIQFNGDIEEIKVFIKDRIVEKGYIVTTPFWPAPKDYIVIEDDAIYFYKPDVFEELYEKVRE